VTPHGSRKRHPPLRWDNLVRLADEWQAQPQTRWLELNTDLRAQAGHGYVRSVGGLEGQLTIVRRLLTDRAHLLTNSVRTQRLLDLMTLQLRGLADERAYATHSSPTTWPVVKDLATSRQLVDLWVASPLVGVGYCRSHGLGEPSGLLLVLVDLLFNGGDNLFRSGV
jgi:hypothetical protein